ncbi:MAG: hypothetical protein CMH52_00120 [Myxococcales bacterium]|nr:hypothetical protein [Myxococcales bacterium]
MAGGRILVADDEEDIRFMLRLHLERADYTVVAVENGHDALARLANETFDCILCDLVMPEVNGLDVLAELASRANRPPFILMSAHADIDVALKAINNGAVDYIAKPFRAEEVLFRIRRAIEQRQLSQRLENLEDVLDDRTGYAGIVAKSAPMQEVFRTISKVKDFQTTVLITGESGTGKELVAKALHYKGQRQSEPFIAVNCGAIPEALLESELFGHVRGAFTDANRDRAGLFQEANKGTLFLDEVGELPLQLQVKLLRVVQEREIRPVGGSRAIPVDVRVVAATVRDLAADVSAGQFRQDLYYRLNVLPIHLPSLRERPADIPLLVQHFLNKLGPELNPALTTVLPAAMKLLVQYGWPGNVRELENVVERTLVLADGVTLQADDLPSQIKQNETPLRRHIADSDLSIKKTVRFVEQELITRALEKTSGNRTKAAQILEISHRALLYKIKEYGLNKVGK